MGENFGPSYFAIITGPLLDNRALAANAKLLYARITSLTDRRGYCWASNKYLADSFGWGERTVTRLVAQLQKYGFIRTVMVLNNETGKMERRIYIGNEAAEGVAKIGDPSQNWRGGVAKTGEAIIRMNSKEEYIPPKAPQGAPRKKREPKTTADWMPEKFEKFWEFYRTRVRKEDRAGAAQEWDKLKPDDALIARIYRALEKQLASDLWKRGVGIPYAIRYLKNRRWEDVEDQPDTDHASGSASAPRRYIRTDVIDGQEVGIYE